MRSRLTALAACVTLAAMPLAGCGKKAPGIPRSDASELTSLLRTAQRQADDPQKCDALLSTTRELQSKVSKLSSSIDSDVRDSLTNGIRNLRASAQSQCAKTQTTPTTPETTPTVPTTPPATTESIPTTPPETTPPETTPSQTAPPTPTTPGQAVPTTPGTGGASPGNGNGNGNGNGKKPKKPKRAKGAGHGGKKHR